MDKVTEIISIVLSALSFFAPTPAGAERRRRRRRYNAIKKLRNKRDKEKISIERYEEQLSEIERRFKK